MAEELKDSGTPRPDTGVPVDPELARLQGQLRRNIAEDRGIVGDPGYPVYEPTDLGVDLGQEVPAPIPIRGRSTGTFGRRAFFVGAGLLFGVAADELAGDPLGLNEHLFPKHAASTHSGLGGGVTATNEPNIPATSEQETKEIQALADEWARTPAETLVTKFKPGMATLGTDQRGKFFLGYLARNDTTHPENRGVAQGVLLATRVLKEGDHTVVVLLMGMIGKDGKGLPLEYRLFGPVQKGIDITTTATPVFYPTTPDKTKHTETTLSDAIATLKRIKGTVIRLPNLFMTSSSLGASGYKRLYPDYASTIEGQFSKEQKYYRECRNQYDDPNTVTPIKRTSKITASLQEAAGLSVANFIEYSPIS